MYIVQCTYITCLLLIFIYYFLAFLRFMCKMHEIGSHENFLKHCSATRKNWVKFDKIYFVGVRFNHLKQMFGK